MYMYMYIHTNTCEQDWVCIPVHNELANQCSVHTLHMWLLATFPYQPFPLLYRLKVIAMSAMHPSITVHTLHMWLLALPSIPTVSKLWPRCHASLTSTENKTITRELLVQAIGTTIMTMQLIYSWSLFIKLLLKATAKQLQIIYRAVTYHILCLVWIRHSISVICD